MMTHLTHLLSLAAAAAFALTAPAQVPEGSAVVGTVYLNSGTPGLYVVDLQTAAVTAITGLPADLTAMSPNQGSWSAALRSSDGAIIVGEVTSGAVHVHVLHLTGMAVTSAAKFYLGTPSAGVGRAHVVALPNDLIYVSVTASSMGGTAPTLAGPLSATGHGILDTSTSPPTLNPLPAVSGFPTGFPYPLFAGGVVVDPTGTRFYQLFSSPFLAPTIGARLMTFDFATLTWCEVAHWPGEGALGLVMDDDGTLHVSASVYQSSQDHVVHSLRPDGCIPGPITTVTSLLPLNTAAFAMDRCSGKFLQGTVDGGAVTTNKLSLIDPATGEVTLVTAGPASGWARIGGAVAINNQIESYGNTSDGQNRYTFANFPNPGGKPNLGNSGFSLTMAAVETTPVLSVLGLSLGRGSLSALGINVLLDLNTLVAVPTPAGTLSSYPLPIPVAAGLVGQEFTAQSVHLEAGGNFAASAGLSFVIGAMPAPTISSVTLAVAGATATVQGTDFWTGLQLQIEGVTVPIASQTPESLTFVMPAGVGCDAVLTLSSFGGSATETINQTPGISSSTPQALAGGGSQVIITGNNLASTTVTIAGTPMTITTQAQGVIVGICHGGPIGLTTLVVSNANGCQATAGITLF